jgi:hypothetical protein
MATFGEVSIAIKAVDDTAGAFKSVQGRASGLGKTFGDVGKIAGGFVMAQGILKAPGFFADAAQAAADDAAAQLVLQRAVENTGAVYATYARQLDTTIKKSQDLGFADDQSREALALLTAQTGSAGEAQKRWQMAMDLSRGANIDVVTASRLLGKVTEENVNVLSRYGIAAREGMSETELFGMIQQKFGGQAETFAKSAAGQMERAKIGMGELKESLGYLVLPALTKLVKTLNEDIVPAVQKFIEAIGPKLREVMAKIGPKIEALADVLKGPLGDALKFFADHREMLLGALAAIGAAVMVTVVPAFIAWAAATVAATWPILAIIAAGALLGLGIKALIDHWDDLKSKTLGVWEAISSFIDDKFGFLRGLFETAFTYYKNVVLFYFEEIKNVIVTTLKVIKGIIDFAMAILHGDWSAAWTALKDIVSTVWEGIKGAIGPAIDLVRNQLQLLWDKTDSVRKLIAEGFQAAWTGLAWVLGWAKQMALTPITNAFDALKEAIAWVIEKVGDLSDALGRIPKPDLSPGFDIPGVPLFQRGVKGFRGGLAVVGEKGPELLRLPRGSDIIPSIDSPPVGGDTYNNHVEMHVTIESTSEEGLKKFQTLLERTLRRANYGGSFVTSGAFAPS